MPHGIEGRVLDTSLPDSVCRQTWHDVLVEDVDVVAPVGARVFVPEADHVTELVHDDAELVAVLADRDRLRPAAAFAHERTTPAPTTDIE